jgi:outer membrane immunogenic protein
MRLRANRRAQSPIFISDGRLEAGPQRRTAAPPGKARKQHSRARGGPLMNKMLLLAGLVGSVILGSGTVQAADPSWTGFYIGANAGYGFSRISGSATPGDPNTNRLVFGQPVVPPLATSFDSNGWLAGAVVGFNWQVAPQWVAGIEADFDGAGIKGSSSMPSPFFAGFSSGSFNVAQDLKWFGTVRGRLASCRRPIS